MLSPTCSATSAQASSSSFLKQEAASTSGTKIIPADKKEGGFTTLCSAPIHLSTYFSSYANNILELFNYQLEFTSKPKKLSSIIACEKKELCIPLDIAQRCSINKLTVEKECPGYTPGQRGLDLNLIQQIPQAGLDNLASLRLLKDQRDFKVSHFKERAWNMPTVKGNQRDLQPLKEIIITIRIHKPFEHKIGETSKMIRPRTQQEVLVLGRHTLDVLRDLITCPNHFAKMGDFSEMPYKKEVPFAKDLYKSGFIFIENKFYNDSRDPNNFDYSEVIRDWAARNPRCSYGKLETGCMETTMFQDLSVRMGYPYVYQHQGSCEHLIVFLNAKLINRPDELCSLRYPMQRNPYRISAKLCTMCGFYAAKWVTFNNKRVPHDPAYFCENCFFSYNYKDGEKIGEFSAHPYTEEEPEKKKNIKYSVKVGEEEEEEEEEVEEMEDEPPTPPV